LLHPVQAAALLTALATNSFLDRGRRCPNAIPAGSLPLPITD